MSISDRPHHTPAVGIAAGPAASPSVTVRPVECPTVLDRTDVLLEAIRQTEPFANQGARRANAQIIQNATARRNGLRFETALRQVSERTPLEASITGRHPGGLAAEHVAVLEYNNFEAGRPNRLINPPAKPSPSVVDVRVAPDSACKRDLWFVVKTKKGVLIAREGGQVKTGDPEYITRTLVKMAETRGYGKMGVVDGRYVNADGTPRIATDAFTDRQARRLQRAGVRLRGIDELEARAERLVEDIAAYQRDGMSPLERAELEQLRDDIAKAYGGRGVLGRVAGGAAIGFATGALLSLILQKASGESINAAVAAEAGGQAALLGGATAAADAGIYHAATNLFGLAPEAAKTVANHGVSGGLCVLAIGIDVWSEVHAVRAGERTAADAIMGGSAKAALDLLPLLVAPLGLWGIPVLIGTQVGGRLIIERIRCWDRQMLSAFEQDVEAASNAIKRAETASYHAAIALDRASSLTQQLDTVLPDATAAN